MRWRSEPGSSAGRPGHSLRLSVCRSACADPGRDHDRAIVARQVGVGAVHLRLVAACRRDPALPDYLGFVATAVMWRRTDRGRDSGAPSLEVATGPSARGADDHRAPDGARRLSAMLERYYVRPTTVDRLQGSWLGEPLEQYVSWLSDHGYAGRNVFHRVPRIMPVRRVRESEWFAHDRRSAGPRGRVRRALDQPQGLSAPDPANAGGAPQRDPWTNRAVLAGGPPGFTGRGRTRRRRPMPFPDIAPAFVAYLREERGLREAANRAYQFHLEACARTSTRLGLVQPTALSPVVLSGFFTDTARGCAKTSVRDRWRRGPGVPPLSASAAAHAARLSGTVKPPRVIACPVFRGRSPGTRCAACSTRSTGYGRGSS